ncbi:MAG: lipocalin family protein [Chromatiaceae bacterium]|nr:lipocalin family protein [Chromatiaceae bacterium]
MIKRPLFALRALLPGRLGKPRQPPATVARVDLDRLLGTWFEVARLPNLDADGPWQDSVNVTATYTKRPDGCIRVQTVAHNAKAGMRRSEVNGSVHPADPSGSKLILRFFKLIHRYRDGRLPGMGGKDWAVVAVRALAVADEARRMAPTGVDDRVDLVFIHRGEDGLEQGLASRVALHVDAGRLL